MGTIKHIWFDFSETIANINADEHDKLKYQTYAAVLHKPLEAHLKQEFDHEYAAHNHSISDVFFSLGKPAGWWSQQIAKVDATKLFVLAEEDIPEMLRRMKQLLPISIFSNINLDKILPSLKIDPSWFTHILSSGMVNKPKPALDGFYKMIELSGLSPAEVLYIGDHVAKDIIPAKEVGLLAGIIWHEAKEADFNFTSFREILELAEKQVQT